MFILADLLTLDDMFIIVFTYNLKSLIEMSFQFFKKSNEIIFSQITAPLQHDAMQLNLQCFSIELNVLNKPHALLSTAVRSQMFLRRLVEGLAFKFPQ